MNDLKTQGKQIKGYSHPDEYDEWFEIMYEVCKRKLMTTLENDIRQRVKYFDVDSVPPLTIRILHQRIVNYPELDHKRVLRCSHFGVTMFMWAKSVYEYCMLKIEREKLLQREE